MQAVKKGFQNTFEREKNRTETRGPFAGGWQRVGAKKRRGATICERKNIPETQ